MAKLLLKHLDIEVSSHVVRVGRVNLPGNATWDQVAALRDPGGNPAQLRRPGNRSRQMKAEVDHVLRTGDSIGGVFEVVVHGVPAGLGTYANWDERLDGLLAWAVMSLQAVKAVELGQGVTAAESFGSAVHDADRLQRQRKTAVGQPGSPANATTPVASKAASPTVKTSWCVDILSPYPLCAGRWGPYPYNTREVDQGGLRALRCLCGPCCRRGCRSYGGIRDRQARAGKVRRRLGR